MGKRGPNQRDAAGTPEPEGFEEAMRELGVEPMAPVEPPPPPRAPRQLPARRSPAARAKEPRAREEPIDLATVEDPGLRDTLRRIRAASGGGAEAVDRSSPRIDLHGLPVDDAVHELRRFVDLHAGLAPAIRVVTGRGSHAADGRAAVREAVEEWLARSPRVVSWRRGTPPEGGSGLIVVTLRRDPRRRP